jgi:hypothetical protein
MEAVKPVAPHPPVNHAPMAKRAAAVAAPNKLLGPPAVLAASQPMSIFSAPNREPMAVLPLPVVVVGGGRGGANFNPTGRGGASPAGRGRGAPTASPPPQQAAKAPTAAPKKSKKAQGKAVVVAAPVAPKQQQQQAKSNQASRGGRTGKKR